MKHFQWFALLTRSNFERTVHTAIQRKRIEAFLPTIKKASRRKDRKRMIDWPLFPGYIFVRSTTHPGDQLQLLKTIGAVRVLGNTQGPLAIPDVHIESLKLLCETEDQDLITGSTARLKPGDPVMIIEGPMAGLKGEFHEHRGKGRVIVKLDLLGQYAGVEVDSSDVKKIPSLNT
ncbi:MAG: transcriptional antiterminator [Desulfobacterales bacterium]|nr:MAG: transcriptional antiterminator [Desulfobacterales bacterium]